MRDGTDWHNSFGESDSDCPEGVNSISLLEGAATLGECVAALSFKSCSLEVRRSRNRNSEGVATVFGFRDATLSGFASSVNGPVTQGCQNATRTGTSESFQR